MDASVEELLGRLHFRLSANQNTLAHSIEVAQLCAMLAAEIGIDPIPAKRAGLLHDLGKAIEAEAASLLVGAVVVENVFYLPGLGRQVLGAALAHARHAELIPDLLHVHPGAIKVALRAIPHLYCVTDSTAATGMPDGEYMLGRHTVMKCMGGVRLADGTLAGSTLTMDQALRNLVGLGLELADASARVSTNAADYLGLQERGRLAPGAYADLVVLDRDLNLKAVYIEGELL